MQTRVPGLTSGFGPKQIENVTDFHKKNGNPSLCIFNAPGMRIVIPKCESFTAGREILSRGSRNASCLQTQYFINTVMFPNKRWCGLP